MNTLPMINIGRGSFLIALISVLLTMPTPRVSAQSDQDYLELVKTTIKADRVATVVSEMSLTEAESVTFWPLYNEYRFQMDKIANNLTKLVLDYAGTYPDVSEESAKKWLKEYTNLQRQQVDKRTSYLEKFSKVLPANKALRFAQVDTRLDLLIHLQIAVEVPLVPVIASK